MARIEIKIEKITSSRLYVSVDLDWKYLVSVNSGTGLQFSSAKLSGVGVILLDWNSCG